jgi:hypothetical protein
MNSHQDDSSPIASSDALRLITRRGEGLVKMLDNNFSLDNPANQAMFESLNNRWNFLFNQIVDPVHIRPDRRVIPQATFGWDPLLKKPVDPSTLQDVKGAQHEHTCMTSTSLLPRDGKMALFGTDYSAGVGLLFDIRLCDLKGERFVFERDAFTDNDWWLNPTARKFQNDFPSQSINDLRINTGLEENTSELREYNEIQAGVNAKALSAITLQPPTQGRVPLPGEQQYYHDRFNAIYRKLYVASIVNRHLPIIILDAHNGPYEYTVAAQQADLTEFLATNPSNSLCKLLLAQNTALDQAIPVEHEEKVASQISPGSLEITQKTHAILLDKIMAVGDEAQVLNKIIAIQDQVSNENNPNNVDDLNEKLQILSQIYHQIKEKIQTYDQQLQRLNFDNSKHLFLQKMLEMQLAQIAKLTDLVAPLTPISYTINRQQLQDSLAQSHNIYLNTEGITYSKDSKSKSGINQLFSDFNRQFKILDLSPKANSIHTAEELEHALTQKISAEELETLKQHYSQGPLLFTTAPLNTFSIGPNLVLKQPFSHEMSNHLYKENNEFFIKCSLERFPILDTDTGEIVDFIPGPMEVLFKLTEAGFQFQEMKTSSQFLSAVYLGAEITPEILQQYKIKPQADALDTIQRYKEACTEYLSRLQHTSHDEISHKQIAAMKELQALLYQNECGLFLSTVSPLNLDHAARTALLGQCEAAYVMADNELFYIAKNKSCIKVNMNLEMNTLKSQLATLSLNLSPLAPDENGTRCVTRCLSSRALEKFDLNTHTHHPQGSATRKLEQFHEKLAAKKTVLTKRQDNALVTFAKALGYIAITILSLGQYRRTAYEGLFGKKATYGNIFVNEIEENATKRQRHS